MEAFEISGIPTRIVDNYKTKLLDFFLEALQKSSKVWWCSAFLTTSGLKLLEEPLIELLKREGELLLLLSAQVQLSEAKALKQFLNAYPKVRIKVYTGPEFLHAKLYLFQGQGHCFLAIGSSNLTEGGLLYNIEHNLVGIFPEDSPFVQEHVQNFYELWGKALSLDEWLKRSQDISLKEAAMAIKPAFPSPLSPGTRVRVYGNMGTILRTEPLPEGRYRYTIDIGGRVEVYTSPPTSIEPLTGPIEAIKSGQIDPEINFDFVTEAFRLSLIYEYDKMVSLSSSRVNLEPYQVEAVHQIVNTLPHRFFIADEPGLGKTIETSMILAELMARGRAERVLIIVPAPLVEQWRSELKEAIGQDFVPYRGSFLRELARNLPPEQNPWQKEKKVITSIDLAKREEWLPYLERTYWDVVIFDEAHKLSARRYDGKIEETDRYKLGRLLAERCDSLLLLSGTPHNGHRYSFYALLSLLDEYAFPNEDLLDPKHVARFVIRRSKKHILDVEGKPVFVNREIKTLPVEFTESELALYELVSEYVRQGYEIAKSLDERERRAAGFVLVLFQKRMVSSIEAIRRSLKRRLETLERKLKDLIQGVEIEGLSSEDEVKLKDYWEDPDSLEDKEREDLEKKAEVAVLFKRRELIEWEINFLKQLCSIAEEVTIDSKAQELLRFLEGIFETEPEEKVIVFTEYTDTLEYLAGLVEEKGWKYALVHGGMGMMQRKENQKLFEQEGTKVLIATDAAGEGLNLHWKCHLMINYELPWNPNRIEQRIGRLHRYGQKRDVRVFNLFVTNTREDQILSRLLEKLATIKADLPGADVYDVLGALLEGIELQDLVMEAVRENKDPEVTAEQIATAARERAAMLEKVEKELLQDVRRYDHEASLKLLGKVRQASATNEDLKLFAEAFLSFHGTRIRETKEKGVFRITSVPVEIRTGSVLPTYEKVTFDREIAKQKRAEEVELIAFGHPLFDSIVSHCKSPDRRLKGLVTIKRVANPDFAGVKGILFHWLLRVTDGHGKIVKEELYPVFVDDNSLLRSELVEFIPKFQNLSPEPSSLSSSLDQVVEKVDQLFEVARRAAEERVKQIEDEAQEKREREIRIRREDLERYAAARELQLKLERHRIEERLKELETQTPPSGMSVDIRIAGERHRLEENKARLKELHQKVSRHREDLESMEIIVREEPELLNLALVEFISGEVANESSFRSK